MGAGLSFDSPTDSQQRREYAPCLRGRPVCSRRLERHGEQFARCFLMFEALSQDPQRERLDLRNGLGLIAAVAQHTRKVRNLGDPPAILFAFEFDLEGHTGTLAPGYRHNKPPAAAALMGCLRNRATCWHRFRNRRLRLVPMSLTRNWIAANQA